MLRPELGQGGGTHEGPSGGIGHAEPRVRGPGRVGPSPGPFACAAVSFLMGQFPAIRLQVSAVRAGGSFSYFLSLFTVAALPTFPWAKLLMVFKGNHRKERTRPHHLLEAGSPYGRPLRGTWVRPALLAASVRP